MLRTADFGKWPAEECLDRLPVSVLPMVVHQIDHPRLLERRRDRNVSILDEISGGLRRFTTVLTEFRQRGDRATFSIA